MLVALPVVSFFCVAFLAALAAGPRTRTNAAHLALVLWLLICNFIQGINSLVWAGNTDIHVPRWCDLVTKLLLGLIVAIPGACICMALRLVRVHSDQKETTSTKRLQYVLDGIFCFIVPIIYMCLHFIVQDHRFDIVENFGCSASIFPSNESLVLMLTPPMLLGVAAFFLCTRAFHNFSRSLQTYDAHGSATTRSSFPDFSRRVSTVMILGGVTTIVTLFGIFVRSNIIPWTSLAQVHRNIHVIAILKSDEDLVPVEFAWWSVSSISWLYIGLSLVLGEDVRDAVKAAPAFFKGLVKKTRDFEPRMPRVRMPRKPLLPIHRKRNTPVSSMLGEPRENYVSGWDDAIDLKASIRQKTPTPSRTRSPDSTLGSIVASIAANDSASQASSSRSPTASIQTPDDETFRSQVSHKDPVEDIAFSASTMEYLHSPTAHSLGLPSPPSIYSDSPIKIAEDQPIPRWQPPRTPAKLVVPQTVPDDVESTISSIFDTPWPQPPCSPLPFTPRTANGNQSPAISETVYGEHDGPYECVRNYALPFRGPGISPVSPLNVGSRTASPTMQKTKKYLRRDGGVPNDVVYMTFTQETA
ncbi:hypothetical protein GYMLUDRAFT_98002 [Collybiopsis luxurians FD-317 M1]|uniref:Pheromone receptor n=1 Tax=Collybiopsis luxurians FD-317 M1 TaxID=944289 RepID=A0A0D0CK44_9AGAR|nr:hypothetical protein GYMLUDRAFT_98002 [Collybiopsis luxurians FD-317 M1]